MNFRVGQRVRLVRVVSQSNAHCIGRTGTIKELGIKVGEYREGRQVAEDADCFVDWDSGICFDFFSLADFCQLEPIQDDGCKVEGEVA